jgi:hypothetical protein
MSRPPHSSRFYHLKNVGWGVERHKICVRARKLQTPSDRQL